MAMRKLKKGDKANFIRKMPDAPASEVVQEAARHKMKLTEEYVSSVRSADRRRNHGSSTRSSSSGDAAEAVRRGFAELGLARSRAVLAEVEATFQGR